MVLDPVSSLSHHLPTFRHERALRRAGYTIIAGLDEAGRGAWAGPVYAAAVILPITATCLHLLRGVNDSKQLTSHQRDQYRQKIEQLAYAHAVGSASHDEVDVYGVVQATRLAMMRAIARLSIIPDALVIDAVRLPDMPINQDVFYYADTISLS